MSSLWYTVEDYAAEITNCILSVTNRGLSYVDDKLDGFMDRLKRNKCKVGDYCFAAGEAWKDTDGRIRTCLRGGRVAIVSGLDHKYSGK